MAELTPEQIKAWRNLIAFKLNQMSPGAGIYAAVMPESEVIEYWRKMKVILESPEVVEQLTTPQVEKKTLKRTGCPHTNKISGSNGDYCLECEKYI